MSEHTPVKNLFVALTAMQNLVLHRIWGVTSGHTHVNNLSGAFSAMHHVLRSQGWVYISKNILVKTPYIGALIDMQNLLKINLWSWKNSSGYVRAHTLKMWIMLMSDPVLWFNAVIIPVSLVDFCKFWLMSVVNGNTGLNCEVWCPFVIQSLLWDLYFSTI